MFFGPIFFFNKGKTNIFGQKSPKICQSHLNTCIKEFFLTFLINFLFFGNFDQKSKKKKKKKNTFWPKFQLFGQKCQYLQNWEINQKSEKTFPRCMYLDGLGKFLVTFVQKNIFFFTLVKKKLSKKKNDFFGDFSKIRFLAENLTI